MIGLDELDERLTGVHEFASASQTNVESPPEVLDWFAKAVLKACQRT